MGVAMKEVFWTTMLRKLGYRLIDVYPIIYTGWDVPGIYMRVRHAVNEREHEFWF